MKFIALVLAMSSLSSFAATVHKAYMDPEKKNIYVEVSYVGGCKKRDFKLKMQGCAESYPVQCKAEIVSVGAPDFCEAIVGAIAVFNISKHRLDEAYYSRGSLTITGDLDSRGKPSSATITLP